MLATSATNIGSDVGRYYVPLPKKTGSYILNGIKYWITNGGIADYMTVFATVDQKLQRQVYAHSWLKKAGRVFQPDAYSEDGPEGIQHGRDPF